MISERALKCPQCSGPLSASRFARSVVCPFCGTTVLLDEQGVRAERFRQAFRAWNDPAGQGAAVLASIGESHWATGALVATGEISDVYAAERARWPSERALLKVLRDAGERPSFEREWEVLLALQRSEAPGSAALAGRLPQPIAHGEVTGGAFTGARATLLRWAGGYVHTFEDVRRAFPKGIEPRASIWIWRRILEALTFVHASGFVHGAVLPQHLLVEDGEHGVRLVGFRCADRPGGGLRAVCPRFERLYPAYVVASRRLAPAADLAMSGRCVAVLLGGDPATDEVPASVPAPLAEEIARASALGEAGPSDPWALRERLGELAREVFGRPTFCPIRMPQEA